MNISKIILTHLAVGMTFAIMSCKKMVQVDAPVNQLDGAVVYNTDANAISVLTGIFQRMDNGAGVITGSSSISFIGGLSADELITTSSNGTQRFLAYHNALTSANSPGVPFWSGLYTFVYATNTAIDGITASNSLTPAVKQQLLGEAWFIRAFLYFYLVNFFGDVPMPLSNSYASSALLGRSPAASVYQQIIADLQNAMRLLSSQYLDATLLNTTGERTRPTVWAAAALLARVYLYNRNWVGADSAASAVINNSSEYNLVMNPDSVFLKNSKEAIWQLEPTTLGYNTEDARYFVLTGVPSALHPVSISAYLLNAFEPNDKRRYHWIDSVKAAGVFYYFPYKYKIYVYNSANPVPNEYLMLLRLAEQFLIRAEARANEGNITGAITDLNTVRSRAGLPAYSGVGTLAAVTTAILHERQVELFTELGQRWLDIKRSDLADSIMQIVTPNKGGSWNSDWALYPLPLTDLLTDPNLIQNGGY